MPPRLLRCGRQDSRLPPTDRSSGGHLLPHRQSASSRNQSTYGLRVEPFGAALTTEQLAAATGLEPSQLSMAIEWLLAKSLLAVDKETVTPVVSLTTVGEQYHAKQSPIEEVLAAARSAAGTGQRLTIQDLQSRDGLDPSDVSKAVGRLKKEGALLIVQGGCIESTGRPSPTAERLRMLLATAPRSIP